MNFDNKVCVVIPTHTSTPTKNQLLAFKQCFDVLKNHSIKVLIPHELNLDAYYKVVPSFEIISIERNWLTSVKNYNALKKNYFFYKLFAEYQFLLTYELDAFVFRDELNFWVDKGQDYIGAPWFEGWHEPNINSQVIGVGNSGFSLRTIQKSLLILKRISKIKSIYRWSLCKHNNILFNSIMFLFSGYFKLLSLRYLERIINLNDDNEDYFWCMLVDKSFRDYYIAPVNEAIKFSFEANPSLLYKINNNELPFGCHAWERYEPEFWINNQFIKIEIN